MCDLIFWSNKTVTSNNHTVNKNLAINDMQQINIRMVRRKIDTRFVDLWLSQA